jgi:hypothetical protein
MKQFIINICQFIALPVLILLMLFYLHSALPLMSDFDYDGGLKIKHQLLEKNRNKKKIIFIGGSNLAMGINSNQIKSSFPNYQIINYGHRFQYGLNFYLSEIKPYINRNDIVVVVPEYQLILDDYFGNQQLGKVRMENLNYSKFEINLSARDILSYTLDRYRFFNKLKEGSFLDKKNHNRVTAFNQFGDNTAHWFWSNKFHSNYREAVEIKRIDVHYLKSFIETFTKKGIQFILIPPIYEKFSFDLCENLIDANVNFYKKAGLSFAYPLDKMVLDSKYFYDSPYHLLNDGVEIKTNKIISILSKEMKAKSDNYIYN